MNGHLEADLPIKSHKQDLLGRKDFARQLAKSIVKATGEGSFVIGIYGKWGSGKTSFLNMVDEFLSEDPSKPIILRFSPWLISEQNQLIGAFLTEIGIALGIKDYGKQAMKAGRQLLAYSKFFTPFKFIPGAEPWVSLAEKGVSSVGNFSKNWGDLKKLNIDEVRSKVEKELRNLGRPVVIFMDDIDRLSKFETRQIFQLVKTVANFPNTSFCLAFDPQHIITALHEDSTGDSQEYLEKIIQAGFDLPQASETEINGMLFKGLDFFIESDNQKPLFDESHWREIFFSGINRLITTPRDVCRLLNRLRIIEPITRSEIDFGDLVAIETLAIKVQPMFQAIRDYSGWFVGPSSEEMFLDKEKVEEESKKGRTRVIESLPAHIQAPTCNLLEVLFPRTGQHPFSSYGAEWEDVWRRKSLLASQDRLQFYLRQGVPPGQVSSETINVILSDTEARDEVLETLIKEKRFEGFLTRVNDFIDDNKINDISHFLKTLTSVVEKDQDALPDKHGFTGTSFVMMTWWAVRKVIENVEPQNRENLIMELCDNPNALSVSEILVLAIQRQHGKFGGDAPHPEEKQLVTLRVADKAKTQWLISVTKSAADMSLVKARAFGSILFSWKRFGKKEDAQKFIADLLKTEDGLAQFMSGIASRIESSSGTSYECNPSILKEFVKVEKIYKLCKQKIKEPKFDELSERAKQAIQSFVSLNEQSSSVI